MIAGRDLCLFTRHLYYLTRTGTPMPEILRNIKWEIQNRELKQAISIMEEKTRRGDSFASTLRAHPHLFPEYYARMLAAAEETDTLPEALNQLAGYIEESERVGRNTRAAALYPVLLLNFLFLFVLVIYVFIYLSLNKNFYNNVWMLNPEKPDLLLSLFHFIFNPFFLIFLLSVVIIADLILFTRHRLGNSFLFNLPWFSGIIRKAYLTRIAASMGFILQSGMTLEYALDETAKIVDIPSIREALERIPDRVKKGASLSDSLKGESFFEGTFRALLKSGEESEELPLALLDTADSLEKELKWQTRETLTMVEPALIVVMGAIIGIILAALFHPLYLIPHGIL